LATVMAVTSLPHDIAVFTDLEGRRNRPITLPTTSTTGRTSAERWTSSPSITSLSTRPRPAWGRPGFTCYVNDLGCGHRVELCSGGYHIFDPDREPLEWGAEDLTEVVAYGGCLSGSRAQAAP
jgi:biphenyl-2,3-diol 1,2-dioxygenase